MELVAWRLQLLAVDLDPGTKPGPVIAHDLELSRDGLQLGRRGAANFYCELFHLAAFFISAISFLTSRVISSIAFAILKLAYAFILNCSMTAASFIVFIFIIFLSLTYPIFYGTGCQAACCLELEACSFFLFLIFWPSYRRDSVKLQTRNLTPDPCTKHAGF